MKPYSEQDLNAIETDPARARAFLWRHAQGARLSGDPDQVSLGDQILRNLDKIIEAEFPGASAPRSAGEGEAP